MRVWFVAAGTGIGVRIGVRIRRLVREMCDAASESPRPLGTAPCALSRVHVNTTILSSAVTDMRRLAAPARIPGREHSARSGC